MINLHQMTKLRIIVCAIFFVLLEQNISSQHHSRSFNYEHSLGEKTIDKDLNPDSLVGNYILTHPDNKIIGLLILQSDGSFVCNRDFGTLVRTSGHWSLVDSNCLILNTEKPQIQVYEFYLAQEKEASYTIKLLKKITEGYLEPYPNCKIKINIGNNIQYYMSDINGSITLPKDVHIKSLEINNPIDNSPYVYHSINYLWSNYFIVLISECLQFYNERFDQLSNQQYISTTGQYNGFLLTKLKY